MGNRTILISYIILNIYFVSIVVGDQTTDIDQWCRQTPHPSPCRSLIVLNPTRNPIRSTTQFVELSVRLTIDRAMQAKNHASSLGPKLTNPREKAALEDCLELQDNTIHRLNQIVFCPTNLCSASDVQTWLSTALTNLDTCRVGLSELRVSDALLPSMLQNVTGLISNALALNKKREKPIPNEKDGFPSRTKTRAGKLLETPSMAQNVDVVVAKDGSGDYTTVQAAVEAAERLKGSRRFVIYVKEGIYKEYIYIGSKLKNITVVGDGIGKTIFTGDRSYGGGYSTFKSATFVVAGDGFVARDITFRNTAGPENAQAVALRSDADKAVFYRCSFEGYQDTLYVHSGRQFFRQCDIYGTVDFIFGNAAAVFQNCRILARNPPNRVNTITAQGRINPNQTTGIVIQNSAVVAAPDLKSGSGSVRTYLGRPWRPYARTVVMKTYLDGLIDPKGWAEWGEDKTVLKTLYYAEYENTGPGSGTGERVKWGGFHVITDYDEARQFSLGKFLDGNSWLPASNIPFSDD